MVYCLCKILEKLSTKEFNVPMYFTNPFTNILPAFWWNNFSSEHSFQINKAVNIIRKF